MSEIIEQPTAEQIAKHYSAAMDSVNLINAGQPEGMTAEDWADCVARCRRPGWGRRWDAPAPRPPG